MFFWELKWSPSVRIEGLENVYFLTHVENLTYKYGVAFDFALKRALII